jgi:N-sulfoglucosamine sulfohydrolase
LFGDDAVRVPRYLPDTPEVRGELAQYYQSVARLDRGVGRLLQVLRQEARYDNTVVLYISDNGAAFPGAKTTLYEPGMHLPLLVRSPHHPRGGTTCDALVTWADLMPTILDFAGVRWEDRGLHGRSFRRVLGAEPPDDWPQEVYASHTFHEITNYYPMRVVRSRRYKFIWNLAHALTYSSASDLWQAASWQGALRSGLRHFGRRELDAYLHRPRFELYDLEADPDEIVNLAEAPACREITDGFCRRLRAFQERTADPWVHKWEYE